MSVARTRSGRILFVLVQYPVNIRLLNIKFTRVKSSPPKGPCRAPSRSKAQSWVMGTFITDFLGRFLFPPSSFPTSKTPKTWTSYINLISETSCVSLVYNPPSELKANDLLSFFLPAPLIPCIVIFRHPTPFGLRMTLTLTSSHSEVRIPVWWTPSVTHF